MSHDNNTRSARTVQDVDTTAKGGEVIHLEEELTREQAQNAANRAQTPFDATRAEMDSKKNGPSVPFDLLPSLARTAAYKTSPFWTKRGDKQRAWANEVIGYDRLADAAQTLKGADVKFGVDPKGYAGVFEHNSITLATARLLAESGLRVVDSHSLREDGVSTNINGTSGKVPRGAKWQMRASTNIVDIDNFWTGAGDYPESTNGVSRPYAKAKQSRNVSIATGGDLMALDLDGAAGLAWLDERIETLPITATQTTGSGGQQKLFRLPAGVTLHNSAGEIAQGVDIRGEGGQIMAGPSIHPSGNFYKWHDDLAPWQVEIAMAPDWLIEAAQAASKKSNKGPRNTTANYAGARDYEWDGDRPRGFEQWLESIGDAEGQRGFDGPIASAAISYFLTNGMDADEGELFGILRSTIEAAYMKAERVNADRYLSDHNYLDGRIEYGLSIAMAIDEMDDDDSADADTPVADTSNTTVNNGAGADNKSDRDDTASAVVKRRQIADALFDENLVRDGFIVGSDKKLRKNKAKVIAQMRAAMNEMFEFVVMEGGDARAFMKADDGASSRILTKAGLRDMFANRTVAYQQTETKVVQIHPATEFFNDPNRTTYLGTQFEPDPKKAIPLLFNLWSGFAVTPAEGDWSLLRGHIRDQIIAGNESAQHDAEYLFNWIMMRYAHMFQYPGQKIGNAIVYKGEEGTGKTKLTEWLRTAIGVHAHKIAQRKHLVGNFNGGLDARIYVAVEETVYTGDKEAAGVAKDMITDDKIEVEKKGFETVTRSNYLRCDFVTNEDWVVPTGENGDARRFFVLHVNNNQKQNRTFFKAIDAQMNSGGVEAMVHEFMHWSPADYGMDWSDLRTPPWTPARGEQATHSLSGPRARLKALIEVGALSGRTADGEPFFYDLSDTAETVVARTHLNAGLTDGGRAFGGMGKKIQAAIEDLVGIRAASDTRVDVSYRGSNRTDAEEYFTKAKTVTFPPLNIVREKIGKIYK